MLHQFWVNLADAAGPRAIPVSLAVAAVGLVLWAVGARISRSVFALGGVGLGAWLGMHAPKWFGWPLDSMAVAIGGALALGLIGYWLHTVFVATTLGTLLAAAGLAIAWHRLAGGVEWSLPVLDPTQSPTTGARTLWQSLPADFARMAPYVAGGCTAFGLLVAWLLPTLGRVLTFSLVGTLMLVTGGFVAAHLLRPEWLAKVPPDAQTCGVALAILFVTGAALQWALCPQKPKKVDYSVGPGPARAPRDVRDLGATQPGPLKFPKEARA